MRTMTVATMAVLITVSGFSTVQADAPTRQFRRPAAAVSRPTAPNRTYRFYRGGVFDRLLEFERRTNAWPFGSFRR